MFVVWRDILNFSAEQQPSGIFRIYIIFRLLYKKLFYIMMILCDNAPLKVIHFDDDILKVAVVFRLICLKWNGMFELKSFWQFVIHVIPEKLKSAIMQWAKRLQKLW